MQSKVEEKLRRIEERLEALEKVLSRSNAKSPSKTTAVSISIKDLLALPDSLRKTMIAIQGLKEATTKEVAENTDRTRSVETIYLNQLVRIGYLTKQRRGRKIYFKVLQYY